MRKRKEKSIYFNPKFSRHGYNHVRWVENASRGLRFVGYADKIARINHNGWCIRDGEYNEVLRGVVYCLPTSKVRILGRGRATHAAREHFVYGYADPNNDDCALLCFDLDVSDEKEAARYADRFAELFAEAERDYNRAWDAGREYEDLAEQVKDMRSEALAIGAEMRAAKGASITAPTICATLRAKVLSLYRAIQKARARRAELLSDFGTCEGWQE